MSKSLKLCSGAEAVRKFQRAGWSIARQKGSHIIQKDSVVQPLPRFLNLPTISTYRSRILQKMNFKNNAEIISYAIKNKLV